MLVLFDLLHYDRMNLRPRPLFERKQILASLFKRSTHDRSALQFSEFLLGNGKQIFANACRLGWGGVMAKRLDAPYISGRTVYWQKIKCESHDDFVVGGYTVANSLSRAIKVLVIGKYEGRQFRCCGRVGTGFSERERSELFSQLKCLKANRSPFHNQPLSRSGETFVPVTPDMVVEVRYTEVTRDGRLRHPSFLGGRIDKNAKD